MGTFFYSMESVYGPLAIKFQMHAEGMKGWASWVPGPSYMDIPMNPFAQEVALQLHLSSNGIEPVVYNNT